MSAKWKKIATWSVRIVLFPLALFFTLSAVRNFLGTPAAEQVTNVYGIAVDGAIAALLFSAVFNSSPPWRNEALMKVLMWLLWIAVLFGNLFFASAAVSYLWGQSFRLHRPASTLQESVAFVSGLGLMLLEIKLVEKIAGRRKKMDYGKLQRFVSAHGDVFVLASGKERKLNSGDLDSIDAVEKAEKFRHDGKWYTKAEFERLVDSSN